MATKTDAPEALSASALWASDSPDDWRAALDAYAQRRDALNHEKLTRLDEWFFHRLTVDVRARTPPCMTAKENPLAAAAGGISRPRAGASLFL